MQIISGKQRQEKIRNKLVLSPLDFA